MVASGILAPVTEPTEWVSSMLVIVKPNKLRICLDPRDLNKAIRREHYQMPTVEEVATRLSQAKKFTVVDAKDGFWQKRLDTESSYKTTFNTPFGRYRWNRMPFGISSAPEVWQRTMHEFVEDLEGVEVIADDFLIAGFANTEHEVNQSLERNERAFLEKCRLWNLKLSRAYLETADGAQTEFCEIRALEMMNHEEYIRVEPPKRDVFRQRVAEDADIQELIRVIKQGWPEKKIALLLLSRTMTSEAS